MSDLREVILRLRDVDISYGRHPGNVTAVRGLSLDVRSGEILGLVGESGSGKSTLGAGILNMLPRSATLSCEKMLFGREDLGRLSVSRWREIRWKKLSYVPQGAMNALNPVRKIGDQFLDIIRDHEGPTTLAKQRRRLETLLGSLHLPPAVIDRFPHQLSGGMKQRVCIVMAIIFEPDLIVADEPTSALDVVSQRVVLSTLLEARDRAGSAVILIGHDLALQAQVADRIGIMNKGQLVEVGPAAAIFSVPRHPYTQLLIASIPSVRVKQEMDAFLREGDGDIRPDYPMGPMVEVGKDHFAVTPEIGA